MLVVPTKFDKQSLQLFERTKSLQYPVVQAYGSMSGLLSSRESHRIEKIDKSILKDHIEALESMDISFWYAMNAACIYDKDKTEWLSYIGNILLDTGVKNLIVSNPEMMLFIHKHGGRGLQIKTSVITDIKTIQQFDYYSRFTNIITFSTAVNRDFNFLEKIRKNYSFTKTELLVNETCLYNCPLRSFHYMREGHDRKDEDIYVKECYKMMTLPNIVRSRWIRPEDLHIYEKYTDLFKISGRSLPFEFIERATLSYAQGKTIGDNLLDIFPVVTGSIENEQNGHFEKRVLHASSFNGFLKHFQKSNCTLNCPCGWCERYADLGSDK